MLLKKVLLGATALSLVYGTVTQAQAQQAQNVIYLVADGAGFNTYLSTNFFNGAESVQESWPVALAMSTYPLRTESSPGALQQDTDTVYDPEKNYDETPIIDESLEFAGYDWTSRTAPDSANTISSSMTGVKTYNNVVNVDGAGNDLLTFAEFADTMLGLRTGVVTTVQWADATPAAFSGVSNDSRGNRNEITDQILNAPYIDVVIGAGNPDFDNDGAQRETPDYTWISEATWTDLLDGDDDGFSAEWQLIQSREDFNALANGSLDVNRSRLLGVVQSFDGKQQYRAADGGLDTNYDSLPFENMREDVPSLPTMVEGALNVLPDNGFFLGIEQGEVDRSMHSNHLGRTIEAMTEFNETVAFIDEYLTVNIGDPDRASYDNTLVVVTADHDHLLLGGDSDTVAFSDPTSNGVGALPNALFQTGGHSNRLIPVFAKGPGSDLLAIRADQEDPGYGAYLDQADLFQVFVGATTPQP